MKSWNATIKIGLFVVAMLILALMDHVGLAESEWGTWKNSVNWNIRASDLDWNILGNDSFHGVYISNEGPKTVEVKWTWKNQLVNDDGHALRTEELELEDPVDVVAGENFVREGWLSTPNDNLAPGTYRIKATTTIELTQKITNATQTYFVTALSDPVTILEDDDE